MPILDVEIVGGAEADDGGTAPAIAVAVATALGTPPGQLWVKLRQLPGADYAENGPPPEPAPVFVRVLARIDDPAALPESAARIAQAVATAVGRPHARVHVIYEPDARGRVFFGGGPDPRRD
jgi:phenylpyruvate tautomerase PptA (4-oxalocrotonate tautomerase family)